jgi:hypothetical protein
MDKSEHGKDPSEGHSRTGGRRRRDKSGHRKNPTHGGHSRTGECRQTDKSEHGKNPTQRAALTLWKAQMDRQVRTRKECDTARGTHKLESAHGQTSQETEVIRHSGGHSHPGERRRSDKSAHGKNPTERGALTDWRAHTDGQVRTQK